MAEVRGPWGVIRSETVWLDPVTLESRPSWRGSLQGPTLFFLNDEPISAERADEIVADYRRSRAEAGCRG